MNPAVYDSRFNMELSCQVHCNENTKQKDCVEETMKAISKIGVVGGGVVFGIAALELMAIVFSCCLCYSIGESQKPRVYL